MTLEQYTKLVAMVIDHYGCTREEAVKKVREYILISELK